MAIIIDQEQKLITLHTKNTTYQMGVGNYGQLSIFIMENV